MSNKMKTILKVVCGIVAVVAIGIGAYLTTPKSYDTYVTAADNTDRNDYTKFDTYLKEDLGITEVPKYIVVSNGKVLATIDPCDVDEFSSKLAIAVADESIYDDFPEFEASEAKTLDGEDTKIKLDDGVTIIQVNMYGCEACENEVATFNKIRTKFKKVNFVKYYIKSTVKDAADYEKSIKRSILQLMVA